jgi:hypothetical protein
MRALTSAIRSRRRRLHSLDLTLQNPTKAKLSMALIIKKCQLQQRYLSYSRDASLQVVASQAKGLTSLRTLIKLSMTLPILILSMIPNMKLRTMLTSKANNHLMLKRWQGMETYTLGAQCIQLWSALIAIGCLLKQQHSDIFLYASTLWTSLRLLKIRKVIIHNVM